MKPIVVEPNMHYMFLDLIGIQIKLQFLVKIGTINKT